MSVVSLCVVLPLSIFKFLLHPLTAYELEAFEPLEKKLQLDIDTEHGMCLANVN